MISESNIWKLQYQNGISLYSMTLTNFTYLVQTIDRFNLLFAEFEIKDLFEEQVKTLRNTVEHRKSASAYNL